jgi:hypothetical protein
MPDFSKLDRPALHAIVQEMVLDRAAGVTVEQLADIERAAFRRGAEAMREAAAQLVIREVEGWMQLGLSGDIRDLPIPEDKP